LDGDNSPFTAAAAAAGYLYQARLALALCLHYAYSEGGVEVSVERLDDVSFERNGNPIELLQTKHHIRRAADLTDASPDLWKTLRIWCEKALEDPNLPSRTRLLLVTTSIVPEDSIAKLLRSDSCGVGISGKLALEAAERLTRIAEASKNLSLRSAFSSFLALTPRMRASLLSAVQIFDAYPLVGDLGDTIESGIRMVAPRGQVQKAREMLEGWWWARIIEALLQQPAGQVSILEVETKLDEIRESLQRGALTAEFEHADPPNDELRAYDDHGFVRQLRHIGVGGNRIEYAKRDYYRAFTQRSHWSREHVILDGEIARFEATLIEEWEPRFAAMCERHPRTDTSAPELRHAGLEIYNWVETEARFPFRTLVKRFLNVGSFHILANAFRLGWHRDYNSHRGEAE
jgi:hypothetical protein